MRVNLTRFCVIATLWGISFARWTVSRRSNNVLAAESNIPARELKSLHDLYVATSGEQWLWKNATGIPWNFTVGCNPCVDHWQGITCDVPAPGQNRHIIKLVLGQYNLKGKIPESVGNLTRLNTLALPGNHLSGSIPSSIGAYLIDLVSLLLFENLLDGPIPASLGNLQSLEELILETNLLNGTIPACLGDLANLKVLDIHANGFTGTIPPSVGNLSSLVYLDFQFNALTHTVPSTISNMAALRVLSVNNNKLSGTFPHFLCNMVEMSLLALYVNELDGSLPECLGNLTNLIDLLLEYNSFSHTIPDSLSNMQNLELLWLNGNSFTGPLPEGFSKLSKVSEFLLYFNYLTGTIPPNISSPGYLQQYAIYDNFFTGPIPEYLGNMPLLQLVLLQNNFLTGSIPKTFQNLAAANELYLQSNRLSGSLEGVFNKTIQMSLAIIQLSDNQLTGTLPDEAFLLPQLNTFVAVSNCFSGSLPSAICRNPLLFSVILDGVQTAPTCRQNLLPGTSKSYVVANNFRGTVPACLFNMPNLTSLHISGNGLSGSLPPDLVVSHRLVDVTISHNALTGTIPYAIQKRAWKTLDLSFNRLNGSLIPDFGAEHIDLVIKLGQTTYSARNSTYAVSLSLENNRLSGTVPNTLVNPYNVTILGTNMYACKTDKSDLPVHDKTRFNYQCGSDSFDYPYYVFLIFVLCIAVLMILRYRDLLSCSKQLKNTLKCLHKWTQDNGELPRNFKYVSAMSDILCKLSVWCTVLILVVLLPWYAAASTYFGTYTHQYAWAVSAAFLSGHTPLQAEIVFYMVLMVVLVVSLGYLLKAYDREEHNTPSRYVAQSFNGSIFSSAKKTSVSKIQRVRIYFIFVLINTVVVVGVNVAYVLVALYQSNTVLIIAQVVISLFKLGWNSVCTPLLIRYISEQISTSTIDTGFVMLQVIIALFNNIAIPCLVVAVVSPACFYSVFDAPPKVNSNFIYESCTEYDSNNKCAQYSPIVLTTSYSPPFRYDYQCSSSFVTYYAPAFVYLAIAAAFATPVAKVVGHLLHKRAIPGTYWHAFLDLGLPRIQQPISIILNACSTSQSESNLGGDVSAHPSLSSRSSGAHSAHSSVRLTGSLRLTGPINSSSSLSYDTLRRDVFDPYFDANIYIISLMTYLGILLTFGVVFPPLSVAMSVTMISVAWQGRLAVGRFLYNAREAGALKFVDIIEQECKGAVIIPKIRRSIFIIICFSCTFYALFLYDTLGNAVGQSGAYWTLIVMPLYPLLVYAGIRLYRMRTGGLALAHKMEAAAKEQTEGVPMSALDSGHSFSEGSVMSMSSQTTASEDEGATFNVLRV